MKKMSPEDLALILRDMAARVEEGDSFDGHIDYHVDHDDRAFQVQAFYRTGNSEGQGGSRIIQ